MTNTSQPLVKTPAPIGCWTLKPGQKIQSATALAAIIRKS